MRRYAIIVAGGTGTRMGGGIPKQFRSISGRPMLWWTMKAFHRENPSTEIILVLPRDFISLWNDFFLSLPDEDKIPYKVTEGGETRTESVKRGLSLIEEDDSLVAVHDAARPMVRPEIISAGWETASRHKAAIPVIPVVDSLRKIAGEKSLAEDRTAYRIVQTPQVFSTEILKKAYEASEGKTFTDDATVVEAAGYPVALFAGDASNIKVTTPADLVVASVLMGENA